MIPVIQQIIIAKEKDELPEGAFCLIISPTRELALQIYEVAIKLSEFIDFLGVKCHFGGKNKSEVTKGEVHHLIIATPGRLREIIDDVSNPSDLKFKNLQYLVMDEADRLLDSNFQGDLKQIVLRLPKQRRTGLFSATLTSKKIEDLIKVGLRNPVVIKLSVR